MIIVTGASSGLGLSICEHLTKLKYSVLGLSRNIKKSNFKTIKCDVTSHKQIKKIANDLVKGNTNVTGIINAAGIASMNLAVTTPPESAKQIINTNLLGTIYTCQILAPLLIRQKKGNIINFSTIAVPLGLKGESIYIASKAGIEGFSRAFAREMSDFNIRVNCIAPGPINTNLLKGIKPKQIKKIVSNQIIPIQFKSNDICKVVESLLDEKLNSISGQTLNIGGV